MDGIINKSGTTEVVIPITKQEQQQQQDGSHDNMIPKNIDITKRNVILKLELTGDVPNKLGVVANTLFNVTHMQQTIPTENNKEWKTTDDLLYAKAKKSYDEIIQVFQSEPKVYKFNSVKEKVWETNHRLWSESNIKDNRSLQSHGSIISNENSLNTYTSGSQSRPDTAISDYQSRPDTVSDTQSRPNTTQSDKEKYKHLRRKSIIKPVKMLTIEEQIATYINPFVISADTNQEIWAEKLDMLQKITPREDLEGYEYREDYYEQQYRLGIQEEFKERMKEEIYRRETDPTEIEQVEDTLYDLIEYIASKHDHEVKTRKNESKNKIRSVWHPSAIGFKMKKLGATENENGEITVLVSDFNFRDFIISSTGAMIAVNAPLNLFEKHANERRSKLELELLQAEEERFIRKQPLSKKLRDAVSLARDNPNAAIKKAMNDIIDKAVYWPRSISEKILEQSKVSITQSIQGLQTFVDEPIHSLDLLSEKCLESYRFVFKKINKQLNKNKDLENSEKIDLKSIEKIIDDEEEIRIKREKLVFDQQEREKKYKKLLPSTLPIQIVDTVTVKLTFLMNPPPLYTMKPPPSIKRNIEVLKKHIVEQYQDVKQQTMKTIEDIQEQYMKPILEHTKGLLKSNNSNISKEMILEEDKDLHKEDDGLNKEDIDMNHNTTDNIMDTIDNHSSNDENIIPDDDGNKIHSPDLMNNANIDSFIESNHDKNIESLPHSLHDTTTPIVDNVNNETTSIENIAENNKDKKQFTLKDEEIDVEAIMNQSNFTGYLSIEDMIPIAFKDDVYQGPLIFDTSDRIEFEKKMIAEIAEAVNLPIKNISIEEIHRLDQKHNMKKLKELKKRKELILNENNKLKIQYEEKQNQLKLERKILAGGIVLDYPSIQITNPDMIANTNIKTNANANANAFNDTLNSNKDHDIFMNKELADVKILDINILSPDISAGFQKTKNEISSNIDELRNSLKLSNQIISSIPPNTSCIVASNDLSSLPNIEISSKKYTNNEDGNEVFRDILNEIIEKIVLYTTENENNYNNIHEDDSIDNDDNDDKESISTDETDPTSVDDNHPQNSLAIINAIPSFDEYDDINHNDLNQILVNIPKDNLNTITISNNNKDEDEIKERISHNSPPISPSLYTKTQPLLPQTFKIGIQNPDELRRDPNYWLAKGLAKLNKEEKRKYRIIRLNLLRKESQLKKKLKEIKVMKEEIIEDVVDIFAPLMKETLPYINKLKPIISKTTQKLIKITYDCYHTIEYISNNYIGSKLNDIYHYKLQLQKHISEDNDMNSQYQPPSIEIIELMNDILDKIEDNFIRNEVQYVIQNICNDIETNISTTNIIKEVLSDLCTKVHIREILFDLCFEVEKRKEIEVILQKETTNGIDKTNLINEQEEEEDDDDSDDDSEDDSDDSDDSGGDYYNGQEEESNAVYSENDKHIEDDIDANDNNSNDDNNSNENEEEDVEEDDDDKDIDHENSLEFAENIQSKINEKANKMKNLNENENVLTSELDDITKELLLNAIDKNNNQYVEDEIITLLDELCSLVEENSILQKQNEMINNDVNDNNDVSKIDHKDEEEISIPDESSTSSSLPLIGCEITFKIFINQEQQDMLGLEELEAEDIAVMIQQQIFDPDSLLQLGNYTSNIVDIQYKLAHRRRNFKTWESFWVHLIHPTFFGYRTAMSKKKVMEDSDMIDGRLRSGIVPLNPTILFNQRNKDTFKEISDKPLIREPGKHISRWELEDQATAEVHSITSKDDESKDDIAKNAILDYNVDEFAADVTKLKLYRPNMNTLTSKDILRLKRLHKAFEEKYEEEMRKGLVDGRGLRPGQYST